MIFVVLFATVIMVWPDPVETHRDNTRCTVEECNPTGGTPSDAPTRYRQHPTLRVGSYRHAFLIEPSFFGGQKFPARPEDGRDRVDRRNLGTSRILRPRTRLARLDYEGWPGPLLHRRPNRPNRRRQKGYGEVAPASSPYTSLAHWEISSSPRPPMQITTVWLHCRRDASILACASVELGSP